MGVACYRVAHGEQREMPGVVIPAHQRSQPNPVPAPTVPAWRRTARDRARGRLVIRVLRVQSHLTGRDVTLLGWLADHGVLTSAEIAHALFPSRPAPALDLATRLVPALGVGTGSLSDRDLGPFSRPASGERLPMLAPGSVRL
jgi:hypothetical protein